MQAPRNILNGIKADSLKVGVNSIFSYLPHTRRPLRMYMQLSALFGEGFCRLNVREKRLLVDFYIDNPDILRMQKESIETSVIIANDLRQAKFLSSLRALEGMEPLVSHVSSALKLGKLGLALLAITMLPEISGLAVTILGDLAGIDPVSLSSGLQLVCAGMFLVNTVRSARCFANLKDLAKKCLAIPILAVLTDYSLVNSLSNRLQFVWASIVLAGALHDENVPALAASINMILPSFLVGFRKAVYSIYNKDNLFNGQDNLIPQHHQTDL